MVIQCYSKQVDAPLLSLSHRVIESSKTLSMTQNLTGIALKPADGTDIWKL